MQLHVQNFGGGDIGGVDDGLGPVLASTNQAGPLRWQSDKATLPPVEARVNTVLEVARCRNDRLLLFLGEHPGSPSLLNLVRAQVVLPMLLMLSLLQQHSCQSIAILSLRIDIRAPQQVSELPDLSRYTFFNIFTFVSDGLKVILEVEFAV